jgi:hypothetical protein
VTTSTSRVEVGAYAAFVAVAGWRNAIPTTALSAVSPFQKRLDRFPITEHSRFRYACPAREEHAKDGEAMSMWTGLRRPRHPRAIGAADKSADCGHGARLVRLLTFAACSNTCCGIDSGALQTMAGG